MVAKPKSEAEAEEMRAKLAAFDEEARAEREKARSAKLKPLRAFVASKAFAEVKAKAAELAPEFADDTLIHSHLQPLSAFMARLEEQARQDRPA